MGHGRDRAGVVQRRAGLAFAVWTMLAIEGEERTGSHAWLFIVAAVATIATFVGIERRAERRSLLEEPAPAEGPNG